MIQFLQAIVLVLTIALQPTTPPAVRQHIFVEVTRIMSQIEIVQLPTSTVPMSQETPSPSAPAPAPSAPAASETPAATNTPPTSAPTDYTPQIEFFTDNSKLYWKTSGVGETLKCTLDGVEVEQEGSKIADAGDHTLRCIGVKSGMSAQHTVTV